MCLILGIALICTIMLLILWATWFFKQWHYLDTIIEMYKNKDDFKTTFTDGTHNITIDVKETRESKLINDIQQILSRAAWQEKEAVRGKQKVTELLSDLSHQLKTPLANIILDIEILESGMADMDENKRQEFLSHAKAQATTMQWLMQCLLKASRLEDGIVQFQAENASIKHTIAQATGAVYAQASKKDIKICVTNIDNILLYHNPKWTAEAIANVLENAVKYSPEKSQITISMDKMDIYTKITIQDQGPGIPETEYNKIFKRFYRGKQSNTVEGTGLGLYLAQLILQKEQGYITVDSKLNRGSRFNFFLLNSKSLNF